VECRELNIKSPLPTLAHVKRVRKTADEGNTEKEKAGDFSQEAATSLLHYC
jgi:hypothetical protein